MSLAEVVPPPPGFRNLCHNKGFMGKTIWICS